MLSVFVAGPDGCHCSTEVMPDWGVMEMEQVIARDLNLTKGDFVISHEGEQLNTQTVADIGVCEGDIFEISVCDRVKARLTLEAMGVTVSPEAIHTVAFHGPQDQLMVYLQLWRDALGKTEPDWSQAVSRLAIPILKDASTMDQFCADFVTFVAEAGVLATEYLACLVSRPGSIFQHALRHSELTTNLSARILTDDDTTLENAEHLSKKISLTENYNPVYFSRGPVDIDYRKIGYLFLSRQLPADRLGIIFSNARNRAAFISYYNGFLLYCRCTLCFKEAMLEEYVTLFASVGWDVHAADPENGKTPLMYLLSKRVNQIPEELFKDSLPCKKGMTALMYAVKCSLTRVATIERLAKIRGVADRDRQGNNVCHHCSTPAILSAVLSLGADVNQMNYHKKTPLHLFVSRNNFHMVVIALQSGANATSPLHVVSGHVDVFKEICASWPRDTVVKEHRELLIQCINHRRPGEYRHLVSMGFDFPANPSLLTHDEVEAICSGRCWKISTMYLLRNRDKVPLFIRFCKRLRFMPWGFVNRYKRAFSSLRDSMNRTTFMHLAGSSEKCVVEALMAFCTTAHLQLRDACNRTAIDYALDRDTGTVATLIETEICRRTASSFRLPGPH